MNYYYLKLVDDLHDGFGGATKGPLIKILRQYESDIGLLEHEKFHVQQWYALSGFGILLSVLLTLLVSLSLWPVYGLAPCLHPLLYKFVRPYRCWSEVQAYRKQIATGGYNSNDFAIIALVEKYDLRLSFDKARALLTD